MTDISFFLTLALRYDLFGSRTFLSGSCLDENFGFLKRKPKYFLSIEVKILIIELDTRKPVLNNLKRPDKC